jgi:hypothetical protein
MRARDDESTRPRPRRDRAARVALARVVTVLVGAALAAMTFAWPVRAQDADVTAPSAGSGSPDDATGADAPAQSEAVESGAGAPVDVAGRETGARPRVAVVLIGDANEESRAAAARVERALAERVELPADAGLRASLVGAESEHAIAPVVRDRRALGGAEAEDVPLLAALGDRADVVLLLVVRTRAGVREVVAFDVRHRAFFEGALALDERLDDERMLRFVRARARAARSEVAPPGALSSEEEQRVARAVAPRPDPTGEQQPDWLENNWPYLLAGALLAGAAAFVIVYTVEDQGVTPMLRFRPGGTP